MNPIDLFSSSEEICSVTIGIGERGFAHCGMLYKREAGSFFLHLGNPLKLSNDFERDTPDYGIGFISTYKQYKWLPFHELHSSKKTLIKTKCIAIAEANKALPYGIYIDKDTNFDAKGSLQIGIDCTGLTCSSFVRILLRSINLNIIDDVNWPDEREDDLVWLNKLIKLYEDLVLKFKQEISIIDDSLKMEQPFILEHILTFNKTDLTAKVNVLNKTINDLKIGEINCFMRFRPEEVAGVCYRSINEMPFKFEYKDEEKEGAGIIGERLLRMLQTTSV